MYILVRISKMSCYCLYIKNELCIFYKHFLYLTSYKTHGCIRRTPISAGQIKKKTKYLY